MGDYILSLNTELTRDKRLKINALTTRTHKGNEILCRVGRELLVNTAVEVDSDTGDNEQVAVNVKKLNRDTVIGADYNAAGNREGTVEPGIEDHTAVALNGKLGVCTKRTLTGRLYAKGR